jgi:hypothetical protein
MAPNDGLAMLAECPGDAVEKVRVWRRVCDSVRERVNKRCGRGVPSVSGGTYAHCSLVSPRTASEPA